MFFTQKINNTTIFGPDLPSITSRAKWIARRRILLYKQNAQEKLLDKTLKNKYNSNLVQMCLRIISNAKFMTNTTDTSELVIVIPDNFLDKIASFITYGNGKIAGSNILKIALEKED